MELEIEERERWKRRRKKENLILLLKLASFLTFFILSTLSFPTSAHPLGGFLKIFPVKPPKGRAEGKERGKVVKKKVRKKLNFK